MPIDHSVAVPPFLYGTAWKEDRTAELAELAIRTGFRGIDTANQRRHYYEAGAGHALAALYREGVISRSDIFLQTKFTYKDGQDHRLPYDPSAPVSVQVEQSMTSSLEHLGTDYVDSFVLHGPASGYGWTRTDAEAWQAMTNEQNAGRTRMLGVSNVSLRHLEQMIASHDHKPAFVQNRCFARLGWDREVRSLCKEHNIVYQGFSLLTANVDVLRQPLIKGMADQLNATPAQVVFAFARLVGMLPLTGTTEVEHMRQDLASLDVQLAPDWVNAIESLAG